MINNLLDIVICFLASFVVTTYILWMFCRINSKRCPNCNSKWQTELVGEWDGEDWHCHNCQNYWVTK